MIKKSTRRVLFFVLVFVLFYLTCQLMRYVIEKRRVKKPQAVYLLGALVYTFIITAIYHISGLHHSSEGFWQLSPGARFKGADWYTCQGDSPEAQECRKLLSSPEGRCQIASYSCPTGYSGVPKIPFVYTPLSNDEWKNERCMKKKPCPCSTCGEDRPTAFERQVPF